jgi:broad specificity phosphatase PhoE
MINIYLIRHAESVNNRHYHTYVGGRSNHTPLTELGQSQAEQLGRWLKENQISFDSVHSSLAIRARDTAHISLTTAGAPLEEIVYSDELLELHQGEWQGRLRQEVYNEETRRIINSDPWEFKAPGGESQREVECRMLSYLHKQIIQPNIGFIAEGNYNAAVYGHGMAIKCALRGILKFDPAMTRKIDIDNTSITKLSYTPEMWCLHYINRTNHLKNYSSSPLHEGQTSEPSTSMSSSLSDPHSVQTPSESS